jgi:hypothetical protein
MRMSLAARAARACLAAPLVLSLTVGPSFAGMGGGPAGSFGRAGGGMGRGPHVAPHGFGGRFGTSRFGFNRAGPRPGGPFAAYPFSRFGHKGWSPLFVGGWGGWGGYGASDPATQPVVVGDSAPVTINISFGADQRDAPDATAAGCVIHKLEYDSAGKYVGEHVIPHC